MFVSLARYRLMKKRNLRKNSEAVEGKCNELKGVERLYRAVVWVSRAVRLMCNSVLSRRANVGGCMINDDALWLAQSTDIHVRFLVSDALRTPDRPRLHRLFVYCTSTLFLPFKHAVQTNCLRLTGHWSQSHLAAHNYNVILCYTGTITQANRCFSLNNVL